MRAYRAIQTFFTLDELKSVAFTTGAKWDELSGEVLSTKAQSLVTWCANRNQLSALYEAINVAYPNANLKL